MAIILPNGKQAFTDGAGAPLVGGKLYTYAAGTNVPQVTWKDANKVANNTNPIILDARGEATIFWDGAYKITLTDALGNLIWPAIDNVTTIDPLVALLLATNGGNLMGFGQSAVATPGTMLAHNQAMAYLQDNPFLAKGDGATLDTAAIVSGINFAKNLSGTIRGVRGSVYQTQTVTINGGHFSLVGDLDMPQQAGSTLAGVTFRGAGAGHIFSITNGGGFKFKNFALDNAGTHDVGINLSSCIFPEFDGIQSINPLNGPRFTKALFSTDTSSFGYGKFRNLNIYSTACPVVFWCGKEAGDPSQFAPPMDLMDSREISALQNTNLTVVYTPQNRIERFGVTHCTFNSYDTSELMLADYRDTDQVVDFAGNFANGLLDIVGCEFDIGGGAGVGLSRCVRSRNTSLVKLDACTITGSSNLGAWADFFNTNGYIANCTGNSINGPFFNILDLESLVTVGPGNDFNRGNTLGMFNTSVPLAVGNFTASTVNGSYTVTITAAAGTVYPFVPIAGAGIPAGAVPLAQLSGVKGGTGTYAISAPATATASGVALTQAAATYPNNSGIFTVPRYDDGAVKYYFIETWRAENGTHTFKIVVTDATPFTIFVSSPFLNNPKPLSHRTRGQPLNIRVENRSGGALGAVTLGSNIQLSAAIAPANTKAANFTIGMDVSIAGAVVTEYFSQIGGIDQTIPVF